MTTGNPYPVQLNIDGNFPLGITVEFKNSLVFVKAVTPGKQCDGKIHVADQVIYVDDEIVINSNDSIRYFQHLVQFRRNQLAMFTVTFLRYSPSHNRDQAIPNSLQVLTTNAMKAMKARGLLKYLNLDNNGSQELDDQQSGSKHSSTVTTKESISTPTSATTSTGNRLASPRIIDVPLIQGPIGIEITNRFGGIRVQAITPGSQCNGKVEVGDHIVEFDGLGMKDMNIEGFKQRISQLKGQKIRLMKVHRVPRIGQNEDASIQRSTTATGHLEIQKKVDSHVDDTIKEKVIPPPDGPGNSSTLTSNYYPPSKGSYYTPSARGPSTSEGSGAQHVHANTSKAASSSSFSSQLDTAMRVNRPMRARANKKSKVTPSSPSEEVALCQPSESQRQLSRQSSVTTAEENDTKCPASTEQIGTSVPTKVKPPMKIIDLCDICGKPDGFLESMTLQKCFRCNISVHEDCYGLANENKGIKYPDWRCHSCASVGKTIKVNNGDTVQVKKRAMACALCPVSKGFHAMTPLYDRHGPEGKPIPAKTRNEEDGIMWVHCLCAQVLGDNVGTKSTIFGCYEDGLYIGGDEPSDENNGQSPNSIGLNLDHKADGDTLITSVIHHFVMERDNPTLLQRMNDFRSLKCTVCKHNDAKSRRIPIQCAYNECNVAFHVGCGHFGQDDSMIEFFPGKQNAEGEDIMDLTARGFCKTHLKIVRKKGYKMPARTERLVYETVGQAKRKLKSLVDGEDGEIFENEVGYELSSDEGRVDLKAFPAKKKARRQHSAASKDSQYFENKRQNEEYSSQMEADLERILKAGTNAEKAMRIVKNSWKGQLSKSVYKRAMASSNCSRLIELHSQQIELQPIASRKKIIKKRPIKNRWKTLFLPNFTFGSVLTKEWDEEIEIIDQEE